MSVIVPFLSPAWLGVALVASLVVATLVPPAWRQWWLVMLAGVLCASLAALVGGVPWTGDLHLTGYSIAMLAAFIAAYVVTIPRARMLGIPERSIIDLFIVGLIGGLIGARIGEMIEQWPGFARDAQGKPLALADLLRKAADIDGGGMVWYGGAILGGVLIVLLAWQRRIRILELADLLMPAVVLGLGLGRVGCFLNGCCYGRPSTLPWAISTSSNKGGATVHPTQLYETIACLGLFALTWWWWRRRRWQGEVAALGMLGYAVWRFFNEGLRGDTVASSFLGLWTVTTSQAVSLYLALGVLALGAVVTARRMRDPTLAALARSVPGSSNHRPAKDQPTGNDAPARG
jgi:phosphatidylglycerol---prolipoprotein diacylglyceryl transferase